METWRYNGYGGIGPKSLVHIWGNYRADCMKTAWHFEYPGRIYVRFDLKYVKKLWTSIVETGK